jgi:hypothetical protein
MFSAAPAAVLCVVDDPHRHGAVLGNLPPLDQKPDGVAAAFTGTGRVVVTVGETTRLCSSPWTRMDAASASFRRHAVHRTRPSRLG